MKKMDLRICQKCEEKGMRLETFENTERFEALCTKMAKQNKTKQKKVLKKYILERRFLKK